MRILLDTHVALWALTGNRRLSTRARDLILDPANDVYFSAATVWEIAIKHRLTRKEMPVSGALAAKLFAEAGYIELPVTAAHAATTERLPMLHADPFDRILVAKSISEPLHLLTHDLIVAQYGDGVELV